MQGGKCFYRYVRDALKLIAAANIYGVLTMRVCAGPIQSVFLH